MELVSQLALSMFKYASIFYFISIRQGHVLAPRNLSQERDTWKGKAGVMELKCLYIPEELVVLCEEWKIVTSL